MNGNLSETLAAGRIIDVMTGGKFDWRARLEDCDFLESGDWLTALAYARAALSPPDAGEVRTYREGVADAARLVEAKAGPGALVGDDLTRFMLGLAAAIRKLP